MPVINHATSPAELLVARPDSPEAQPSNPSPLFASLFQQVRQLSGKGGVPADSALTTASQVKNKKNHKPAVTPADISPQILLVTPDSAPVPSRLNMSGLRALTAQAAGSALRGRAATAITGAGKPATDAGPGGKLPLPAPLSAPGEHAGGARPPATSLPPEARPSSRPTSAPRRNRLDDNSVPITPRQKTTAETSRNVPFSLPAGVISPPATGIRQGRQEAPGTVTLPPFSPGPLPESLPENAPAAGSAVSLSAPVNGQSYWQTPLDQQILFMRRNGVHTAELRLHPRELGSLKISLVMNNDRTDLAFMSDHSQVRSALEAALPHLRHALAESGISLGQSHIGREPPSPFSGFTQSDHSPDQPQSKAAARQEPESLAGHNPSPEPSLQGHPPSISGVDLFA
ncbi:hypothetical protein GCM10009414_27190 [Tatumella terrea]|uniref:flagellar hook-length control protein FliK n=1 Tax=Tatumella terrea TaxID=419007 RepID=UPI0031E16E1F